MISDINRFPDDGRKWGLVTGLVVVLVGSGVAGWWLYGRIDNQY